MKNKQIYIYAIYFPTSKKYYVGQTCNLKRRMEQHLCSDSLVCRALYKYNDWQIEILHTTKDKDAANLLEIEEIRHYNSVVPNGYNITRGGEGTRGLKRFDLIKRNRRGHSKEAIEKIREALKGNRNHQGCHHSKEAIEKIRLGNQGKCYSKEVNRRKGHLGNQYAKGKNLGENNCSHRIDVKIKRLKTRIKKIEQEL